MDGGDSSEEVEVEVVVEQQVMREVHVGCPRYSSIPHLFHFTFSLTAEQSTQCFTVPIQHNITSSIPSVGLQVRKAELVLSDFIMHKCVLLMNSMELFHWN